MGLARRWNPDGAPAMNCADRRFDESGQGAGAAKGINDFASIGFHNDAAYAIIATQSQHISCDNRFGNFSQPVVYGLMDIAALKARIENLGVKQADLSRGTGIDQDKLSKTFAGIRQLKAAEASLISEYLDQVEAGDPAKVEPSRDYMSVEILPSFAGMGGGGTGEGDVEMGMVPRRLIVDELRAKPADVLLIEARGDSMEPDFHHGDQILIDRRDVNPIQPGSFALWDGDGYVVKLVERIPQKPGWYRVFSSNGRYQSYEVEAETVRIMGRPVWFARRL